MKIGPRLIISNLKRLKVFMQVLPVILTYKVQGFFPEMAAKTINAERTFIMGNCNLLLKALALKFS